MTAVVSNGPITETLIISSDIADASGDPNVCGSYSISFSPATTPAISLNGNTISFEAASVSDYLSFTSPTLIEV
jgi:hypothetical protein